MQCACVLFMCTTCVYILYKYRADTTHIHIHTDTQTIARTRWQKRSFPWNYISYNLAAKPLNPTPFHLFTSLFCSIHYYYTWYTVIWQLTLRGYCALTLPLRHIWRKYYSSKYIWNIHFLVIIYKLLNRTILNAMFTRLISNKLINLA